MPTRTDLQVRVLDLLGVTQVGQDPSAEDAQKVDEFITSTVAICKEHHVAIVDPNNVSSGLFEPFATVVANMAAPAFGQQRDDDTIARDKHNLRIAQADEGGAFSRRRREFAGPAQRAIAAAPGFSGTSQGALTAVGPGPGGVTRALASSPGSAGTDKAALAPAASFAGTAQGSLAASGGLAGTVTRSVAAASGFAGTSQSQLAPSNGLAGTAPRSIQGSK